MIKGKEKKKSKKGKRANEIKKHTHTQATKQLTRNWEKLSETNPNLTKYFIIFFLDQRIIKWKRIFGANDTSLEKNRLKKYVNTHTHAYTPTMPVFQTELT